MLEEIMLRSSARSPSGSTVIPARCVARCEIVRGSDVARQFHAIDGDLIELRREAADDDLGAFTTGTDQRDAGEAADGFRSVGVRQFLDAGGGHDVHDRHGGQLLVDRFLLSCGLGGDDDSLSLDRDT